MTGSWQHPLLTMTGKEIMIFSRRSHLLLIARPSGRNGLLSMYAMTPSGMVDLEYVLKIFQLDSLLPLVIELDRSLTASEWIKLLDDIPKHYNSKKKGRHEAEARER